MNSLSQAIDAQTYRSVMGIWPTGVSVVSGVNAEGESFGMVIGSFTSVSMEPPLVAFCPQKASASWQQMRQTERVCINFLSDLQSDVCWKFSSGPIQGRFDGVDLAPSPFCVPRLAGCTAWVDVVVEQEIEAGDHWVVLCRVEAMSKGTNDLPMSFVKGKLSKSTPIFQLPLDHLGEWERSLNLLHTS